MPKPVTRPTTKHNDPALNPGLTPRGDELKALLAQHAAGLLATAVDALPGLLAQYLDQLPTGEQVTAPRGAWSKPLGAG